MIVKDIMTSHPTTVQPTDSVLYAAEKMRQHDVGVLPVVQNQYLCGMLTDRDIVTRCLACKKDVNRCLVNEIMSSVPISISSSLTLEEALDRMARQQIKRLAVTGRDGRLDGIISLGDIARFRHTAETAQALTEISLPVSCHNN